MSFRNHFVVALVFLSGLATMACEQGEGADEAGMGTLEVALTGQAPSGDRYVLRNAVFKVEQQRAWNEEYTQPDLELSTEDDPDSLLLSARVLPGEYIVTLQEGWYIAKSLENGEEDTDVEAVKLSESSQYAWVDQWGPAQVVYQFGIGGELIDFVGGDLQIGIQILEPDAGAGPWPFPSEYDAGMGYNDTETGYYDTEYYFEDTDTFWYEDGGVDWDTGTEYYIEDTDTYSLQPCA